MSAKIASRTFPPQGILSIRRGPDPDRYQTIAGNGFLPDCNANVDRHGAGCRASQLADPLEGVGILTFKTRAWAIDDCQAAYDRKRPVLWFRPHISPIDRIAAASYAVGARSPVG